MKLNISYPTTGLQKTIDVDDENKLRAFYDKRMSQEVTGEALGEEFKGYIFKITGGNDKQGFPMKQGVLTSGRVRVLMSAGHSCYRSRRDGERKRKSVRGCIVSAELSIMNLAIVKKGEQEIPGLTDSMKPRRLGPKRASKIRALFNDEDVRSVVKKYLTRTFQNKKGKTVRKSPKVQRLVTPQRLQRKRARVAEKKSRYEKTRKAAEAFNELLATRAKEAREARAEKLAKRRSVSRKESGKTA